MARNLILMLALSLASGLAWADNTAGGLQAELGFTRDALDKGYADWSSHYIEAENKMSGQRIMYGMLRETSRFNLKDAELMAGYSLPAGEKLTAVVEGNASTGHRVLPVYSVLGQLQLMLDSHWGMQAGMRHTEYDAAVSNLGIFTLERYTDNYRAAYTFYSGHLGGAGSTASQSLQLSRYYADKSWLGLSIGAGTELENSGNGLVQQSGVQSLVFNGRHWYSANWALSYEAVLHRQGDFYNRNGVRFGLRRQF